jgi:hypothetical protein
MGPITENLYSAESNFLIYNINSAAQLAILSNLPPVTATSLPPTPQLRLCFHIYFIFATFSEDLIALLM